MAHRDFIPVSAEQLESARRDAHEVADGLAAHCRRTLGEPSPERWRQMFSRYDRDKDGYITADELTVWLADADVGNFFTRSFWAGGIVDSPVGGPDQRITLDEFMNTIAKSIADPSLIDAAVRRMRKQLDDMVPSLPEVGSVLDKGLLLLLGVGLLLALKK